MGQQVLREVIEHRGGPATQVIGIPESVHAGIYRLTVVGGAVRIVKTVIR
ncbi:MAG TPA: hypothetical protein VEB42_14150 [Chitinophagaceae bacterium]|nr:hypothetical protein [Chitinophagaceae bacterium]